MTPRGRPPPASTPSIGTGASPRTGATDPRRPDGVPRRPDNWTLVIRYGASVPLSVPEPGEAAFTAGGVASGQKPGIAQCATVTPRPFPAHGLPPRHAQAWTLATVTPQPPANPPRLNPPPTPHASTPRRPHASTTRNVTSRSDEDATDHRPRRHEIRVPSASRATAFPNRGRPHNVATNGRRASSTSPSPRAT